MLIALATTVARTNTTLFAGPQVVPHVVGEHAVLDQDVVAGRAPFVVDGEMAPLAGHGAVIDQGDAVGGHLLADAPGEDGSGLGDKIGFKAMTARLVEENTATTWANDNRDSARRSGTGVEFGERTLSGSASHLLDIGLVEEFEADGAAG